MSLEANDSVLPPASSVTCILGKPPHHLLLLEIDLYLDQWADRFYRTFIKFKIVYIVAFNFLQPTNEGFYDYATKPEQYNASALNERIEHKFPVIYLAYCLNFLKEWFFELILERNRI